MATPVDIQSLQQLLKKADAPTQPRHVYIPPNSHVTWTEEKGLCSASEGRCLSPSYLKVDGQHRCLMHSVTDLIDIITSLEGVASHIAG